MRRFNFIAVGLLILSSITLETQIGAQKRLAGPRTQSLSNIERDQENEKAIQEERSKTIKECVTPDRPKPAVEKVINGPQLCGKAISLPKPDYPQEAKAQSISGRVVVSVVVNEQGHVIWAKGIEGHPLLQEAALNAACQARYSSEKISNRAIKVSREISYNFVINN